MELANLRRTVRSRRSGFVAFAVAGLMALLGVAAVPQAAHAAGAPYLDTTIDTISTAPFPVSIAVSPNSRYVYVSNWASNTVSVVDSTTNQTVAVIPIGAQPYGIAVSPDGSRVYAATPGANTVSVIDTATNAVTGTIASTYSPYGVAVSPDGDRLYISNFSSDSVAVVDTATNQVTGTIPVGAAPFEAVVAPDGSRVYVANTVSNTVSVIDTATSTVTATIPVGQSPYRFALTGDGSRLYITNFNGASVSAIDTATNTVTHTITTPSNPLGIAVAPDGAYVYVASLSGAVSVVDAAANSTVSTISTGPAPYAVAAAPDGNRVYVTDATSSSVTVLGRAALAGSVAVSGSALFDTLTVDTSGITSAPLGALSYEWVRDGGTVVGTGSTYQATTDDVDTQLTVRVSAANYADTLTSAPVTITTTTAMQQVSALIGGLPAPIATLGDADQVADVSDAYLNDLTIDEQDALGVLSPNLVAALVTAQNQAGALNHEDASGDGIVSGPDLPWWVRVSVSPDADSSAFAAQLAQGRRVLGVVDISLTNTLTGAAWQPPQGASIEVRLSRVSIDGARRVGVTHELAGGGFETLQATVSGGAVTFASSSFSRFAVTADVIASSAAPGGGLPSTGAATLMPFAALGLLCALAGVLVVHRGLRRRI